MIDKLFNGVIEQVYNQTGKVKNNIVMASYNNEFSMDREDFEKRYSENEDDVFFACCEFGYEEINGAYMPFLDVIYKMFEKYVGGSFDAFLESCGVYHIHREIYRTYYQDGFCQRIEPALLAEVEFEKKRMTKDVANMLCRVAEKHPMVLVINRIHLASRSIIETIINLLDNPSQNIGIVLGANENRIKLNSFGQSWDIMTDKLVDVNHLYHLGYTGLARDSIAESNGIQIDRVETIYQKINNCVRFMDTEYALNYFRQWERKTEEEDFAVSDEWKAKFIILNCEAAIIEEDLSKALDLLDVLSNIKAEEKSHERDFICAYYRSICYMYQGKLDVARRVVETACEEANILNDDKKIFQCDLLTAQIKMSGWYNIFFCVTDIEIEDSLVEKLLKYGYKNHLAHIYIYAYDNRPEVVAKAYRSEALLVHFSKGVELAKEIGNINLVIGAFKKNTMIASTNGMNEIAMLYVVRLCEYLTEAEHVELAMAYVSMGYNLAAIGYNDLANDYYNRSIEMLCEYDAAKEIAETNYNKALNYIMIGKYHDAEQCLEMVMKTIERLHMNSLRVCNLSKLYALLALVAILQEKVFDCERNLINCKQFLNYVLMREEKSDKDVIHDYAMCDDDLFLYAFASALLYIANGEEQEAFEAFEEAERYFGKAEGNQFYVHDLYRDSRAELYKRMGKMELYERETAFAKERRAIAKAIKETTSIELLKDIKIENLHAACRISRTAQDRLSKHVAVEIDYQNLKRQMEFQGIWQNVIDNSSSNITVLVNEALRYFLNYFNNDKAVYIRYKGHDAEILFNNSDIELTDSILEDIRVCLKQNPDGFAVSKVSDNFFEHLDLISYFGVDEVCSFVAIPFMSNGKVQSVFITYVLMKDNWHNSINRYMLNEDDLSIYKLLFRELYNAVNRLYASKQIRVMNRQLAQNAITDMLTGLYNRAGLYKGVQNMKDDVAILFLDLDNFKPYNDTFGHDAGDIVLVGMANIFKEVTDKKGFVCRYGGDEFIIVAHTTDKETLEKMVHEIYSRIEAADGFVKELKEKLGRDISIDENKRLTVSIGIALRNESDKSIDDTIKRADDLMYTVKTNGKGTYAFI